MKFTVSSDLHIDFYTTYANDKLIRKYKDLSDQGVDFHFIAGDISNSISKTNEFVERIPNSIFCYGNHEYYDGNNEISDDLRIYDISGLRVVTTTLWTDFDNMNPLTIMRLREYMNDSSRILNYDENKIFKMHKDHVEFIFDNQPDIVMTHFCPSKLCVNPRYGNLLHENFGYYTEYFDRIVDSRIKYWIYGHSHFRQEFVIGNTKMISNTRGYPHENNNFKLKTYEV